MSASQGASTQAVEAVVVVVEVEGGADEAERPTVRGGGAGATQGSQGAGWPVDRVLGSEPKRKPVKGSKCQGGNAPVGDRGDVGRRSLSESGVRLRRRQLRLSLDKAMGRYTVLVAATTVALSCGTNYAYSLRSPLALSSHSSTRRC